MDNKNKPIYPFEEREDTELGDFITYHKGLTKREYFAVMILQGLLANSVNGVISCEKLVKSSVEYSNDLLNELEK